MSAKSPAAVSLGDLELAGFTIEGLLEILYALLVSEQCGDMQNAMSLMVASGQTALCTITAFVQQGGATRL